MDLEVLRIFVELPIVKGSRSHVALSQFCTWDVKKSRESAESPL